MKREVWVDYLRVTACFMVMTVHGTEPFYIGADGAAILTATDAFWVSVFEALCRCCVPVFLIASSYLQFPLHYSTGEFFKRRALRILVPMVFWTLVYALIWGEPAANLKGLLLNFNYAAGHLWFVYMLMGIYLIMPVLSPWAEKVSRRELEAYLGIWLFTTLIPFIRAWAGGDAPIIQAADGLPAPALFPLWGEAAWNPFGLFYYVSGFVGYLLVGLYLRRFLANNRWTRFLGWTMFLLGFLAIFGSMLRQISETGDTFPLTGPLVTVVVWEIPLAFCGLPVVLSAVGLTLGIRARFAPAVPGASPAVPGETEGSPFYRHVILPLSKAGYGMYLMHMLVLAPFSALYRGWLGVGNDGLLGVWTTPVQVLATALSTFVTVGLAAILVQRIPRVGKWLMG